MWVTRIRFLRRSLSGSDLKQGRLQSFLSCLQMQPNTGRLHSLGHQATDAQTEAQNVHAGSDLGGLLVRSFVSQRRPHPGALLTAEPRLQARRPTSPGREDLSAAVASGKRDSRTVHETVPGDMLTPGKATQAAATQGVGRRDGGGGGRQDGEGQACRG